MRTSTKLFFLSLLGCVIAAVCSGCVAVPSTEINIPGWGTLKSPKQMEIEDLAIKKRDGTTVSIGKLRSVNDTAVINSVSQANVDMIRETGNLVDKVKAATQNTATGVIVP